MASPPPPPSSTVSPSYRPPLESTWQALDRLVEHGLSKDEIMTLSRLGAVGVGKLLDILEREDRPGVDKLLWPLEGMLEGTLGSLIDAVANDRNERGRPPSINPPDLPIDNNIHATTATSLATHYLRPPLPSRASLQRSASTGSRSVSSSRASSSTNITHPSFQHRVAKKFPVSKSARRQFYCPDCEKPIKNGFDSHFRKHIPHLLDGEIGEHDAIGCGYCPANDLLLDQGKVFRGVEDFLHHVKDVHASIPHRLHWDFNASFNHILSAQQVFRRKINLMTEQHSRKSASRGSDTFLTLSWVRSPLTQQLLSDLQAVSGSMDSDPSSVDDGVIEDLIMRVYEAAAAKSQPYSALSSVPSIPQRVVPKPPSHPSSQNPSQDAMSLVGIGQGFDPQTPKYPSFATDIQSLSILSPSAQVPLHVQHTPTPSDGMNVHSNVHVVYDTVPQLLDVQSPMIAFNGPAPLSPPPPAQGFQPNSMEDIYKENGINEDDLFNI